MALWHCGEPTCTWTVTAWRLHIPFSLGITVVFCLAADVSQMACYRINCKVALNWSFALSYANVLCARLFITWIEPHWSPHTHTLTHPHTHTHPPNAPFWHVVSPLYCNRIAQCIRMFPNWQKQGQTEEVEERRVGGEGRVKEMGEGR